MSENKTQPTKASVDAYMKGIEPEQRRKDCQEILDMMTKVSGEKPVIWGDSIVGFGTYHYKGASGREGDWFRMGFSSRKANLTVYLNHGFRENQELLTKLGKHKLGSGCLYLNKLADVDKNVLSDLIKHNHDRMKKAYP